VRTEGQNDRTTERQQASQYIPCSLRSLGGYNNNNQNTRVPGLPCACVIQRLAVLIQYRHVTDGRTDGHKDSWRQLTPRCIASRGKRQNITRPFMRRTSEQIGLMQMLVEYRKRKIVFYSSKSKWRTLWSQNMEVTSFMSDRPCPYPCKLNLYQSQEPPLAKFGWTCPPRMTRLLYTVSQKTNQDVAHYNYDTHEGILIIFSR